MPFSRRDLWKGSDSLWVKIRIRSKRVSDHRSLIWVFIPPLLLQARLHVVWQSQRGGIMLQMEMMTSEDKKQETPPFFHSSFCHSVRPSERKSFFFTPLKLQQRRFPAGITSRLFRDVKDAKGGVFDRKMLCFLSFGRNRQNLAKFRQKVSSERR